MAFARRMTAGDICKEALALQGLPVPTAIATNTNDTTSRQVWAQLRNQGRRLAKPTKTHRWQVLIREWAFQTVPGQTKYPLPPDFLGFEDLTGWNYSALLPLLGPATDPQWQYLKARKVGATLSVMYRTAGDMLELYYSPSSVQNMSIYYTSRAWVQLVNSPDPANPNYDDAPQQDGDIVMLDPEMMVAAVQYGFMVAKGFDTSVVAALLDRLIETAIDIDVDAPILNAAGNNQYPLLQPYRNTPDSGYGT